MLSSGRPATDYSGEILALRQAYAAALKGHMILTHSPLAGDRALVLRSQEVLRCLRDALACREHLAYAHDMSSPASRFDYVRYDETAIKKSEALKAQHAELAAAIEALPAGRATSLALTKLEECFMWVGKAIRDDQVVRNGGAELQR